MEIKIPFLGDGIDSANVIAILYDVGDTIAVEDTIIELETDKATAPVPSLTNGTVKEIHVKEGDVVQEGNLVAIIETNEGRVCNDGPSASASVETKSPRENKVVAEQPVFVPNSHSEYIASGDIGTISCAPSIRRFAYLSGLDLCRIKGSGHGGRITWDDITQYIQYLQSTTFNQKKSNEHTISGKKIDFSAFGTVSTKPLSSMRQKISSHLSNAWTTIPHVTQFADIDIDTIMQIRKHENNRQNNIKLTVTIFIIKAIVETLKKFPTFNSSLSELDLIIKEYYHIGVAVDTDSGLVVPVLRDVDKKGLIDIALELDQLAEKARTKTLALTDIQGATFTLSNLGGLGASHFTPIVNSPEVAILGTGRAKPHVRYDEKNKTINHILLMPVALSYDHRVIDGADGARFMQELTNNIQNFKKDWVN